MPYDRSAFITRTPQEDVAFDFMVEADSYIADKLFDPKPVSRSDTKIYQFDTSKLRLFNDQKGTNAEPNLLDEQLFSRNITLAERKLGAEINPRDVRDADMPQLLDEARKIRVVTNALLIAREARAVTAATTTSNYPSALTSAIASGSRWNEAGGDPEADMITANTELRNRCGLTANALAIDVTTFDKLKLSPAFRSRTQYTMPGPVTEAIMKAYFGVEHLFICKARYDSAVEGATKSIGSFWGSNAIAFYYNPSVDLECVGYGGMYMFGAGPMWTDVLEDRKRMGPAGPMRRVTVGCEYLLASGYTVGSGDTDFAAGYLFRTVVA